MIIILEFVPLHMLVRYYILLGACQMMHATWFKLHMIPASLHNVMNGRGKEIIYHLMALNHGYCKILIFILAICYF
jgi:hypothetical protein